MGMHIKEEKFGEEKVLSELRDRVPACKCVGSVSLAVTVPFEVVRIREPKTVCTGTIKLKQKPLSTMSLE